MQQSPEADAAFAAEHSADISGEKLAEVYATALDGACREKGVSLDDVCGEFSSLLTDVFDVWPKFESILASAMIPPAEKERILEDITKNSSDLFRNFLRTVARRGRLDLLRQMFRQCQAVADRNKGRVPILITTAAPMDDATRDALIAKLRVVVGGEPEISAVVDPETIGGVIVRVGDTVFDASIATQLENVRQQMIDRSAHEIQSRRDSFRYPEGN